MQHHPVAARLAAAVASRDAGRLSTALTETVRLRALLPGGPVESHGRDEVVARFRGWFADFDTVEVVESAGEPVADRLLVHYRLTPAIRDHAAGSAPRRGLQDRRRPAGGDRPAVFRLPRDQSEKGDRPCDIRRSTRGATTTGTTRSRCSRRSEPTGRCTRSRWPMGTGRGSIVRHERGQGRAQRPAAVQGHARRARPRRRRRRRGPARACVRQAHAQRRPARPHPAARAGGHRVQSVAGRGAATTRPVDRRRSARRPAAAAATDRRRPGRGLRLPAAVHRDQRAARRPRAGPGRARRMVHHPAGARLGARTAPETRRGLGGIVDYLDRPARPQARRARPRTWSPTWCAPPTRRARSTGRRCSPRSSS